MADPFARMTERLATRLGSEAFLRGESVTVDIVHGVEVMGEYGQVVGLRTAVEILTPGHSPKVGDALTCGPVNYILDSLVKNDGYSARWIVRNA